MNYFVARVGDEVTLTVNRESREYGYNPFPNGTRGTIVGFFEHYHGRLTNYQTGPGVFLNYYRPIVILEDGSCHHHTGDCMKIDDRKEYAKRSAWWKSLTYEENWLQRNISVGTLPFSPFWEGDIVRAVGYDIRKTINPNYKGDPEIFVITQIYFEDLHRIDSDNRPWPAYRLTDHIDSPSSVTVREADIRLIQRGNVWNYYHGKPLVFNSKTEEKAFFKHLNVPLFTQAA